jgi:hypothetical protein
MVDVTSKRCSHPGCTRQPVFDMEGGKGRFCATHKEPDMVDVTSKRCSHLGCSDLASYGVPGHMSTHCASHRIPGMIRRLPRRCQVCGCRAVYGTIYPTRCEVHREPEHLNLTERPCVSCGLRMVLDADDRCEFCDPPRARATFLSKQRRVMSFLDAHGLPGTQTDQMVDDGKGGKERPDRVYELTDRVIILEVDEHQHRGRPSECEQTRIVNVSQSFGDRPGQWVRFNPDAYRPGYSQRRKRRRSESGGSSDSDYDDSSHHSVPRTGGV